MSTSAKIVMWVIIAVVVVGGIWWWLAASQTAVSPATNPTSVNTTPATSPMNGTSSQPQNASTSPVADNGISATSNSNAALNTDLSDIDGQMNGFSSDNTNVNQGMNDQPVQQSQL